MLRPYQTKLIQDLRDSLRNHRAVIACAPTGSGKTKTFLAITGMAVSKGNTVLVITESLKIHKQISDEFKGISLDSKTKAKIQIIRGGIYIAMAQTLSRRDGIISQFQAFGPKLVVINDEAHIGTANRLLAQFPQAKIIGFTATPDAKCNPKIPEIYSDIVSGPHPQELVDLGFLSSYAHYARVTDNLNKLEIKNGEFSDESQIAALETRQVYDGIVDDLKKVPFTKCLIFCANIRHAIDTERELWERGFLSVIVHSKDPDSDKNLNHFVNGSANVCVSVGILTKGFDFPQIDMIILNRATTSLPLFCQMIGRGSRIIPGVKERFTVIDYGNNYLRHGLWNTERDWRELAFPKKKKKREGVAPIKMCPGCEAIVPNQAKVCPFCGYEWEVKEPEQEPPPSTELIEVTEAFTKIKGKRLPTLSPKELAIWARTTGKRKLAISIACEHNRTAPGWLMEYGLHMNYKQGFAYMRDREHQPGFKIPDFIIR